MLPAGSRTLASPDVSFGADTFLEFVGIEQLSTGQVTTAVKGA
jgi:hypothetical protein